MEKSSIFGFLHRLFRFLDFYILYFHNLTPCWFIYLYHAFTRYYSPDTIDSSGVLHITRGCVILKESENMVSYFVSHKHPYYKFCTLNSSPSQRQKRNYFCWNNHDEITNTRPKHKCTTKLENTSTTKGKGLGGNVLPAVSRKYFWNLRNCKNPIYVTTLHS